MGDYLTNLTSSPAVKRLLETRLCKKIIDILQRPLLDEIQTLERRVEEQTRELQQQSVLLEGLRKIIPNDQIAVRMITQLVYESLTEIVNGTAKNPHASYNQALQIGTMLSPILKEGRGRFFAPLGEGAYHEEGGHKVGGVFVRRFDRKLAHSGGTFRWSPGDIAHHRHRSAIHFAGDEVFPVAPALPPLDYENYSVVLYNYIEGPTLTEFLMTLGNSIAAVQNNDSPVKGDSSEIIKLVERIAQTLVRRQVEQLRHYVHNAPASLRHTGDEIREDYIRSLQRLPQMFNKQLGSIFSNAELQLWNYCVDSIINYLSFDKLVPYRDSAGSNVIVSVKEWGNNADIETIIETFTTAQRDNIGKSVITSETELKHPLRARDTAYKILVNIDTGHRGDHWLPEIYHAILGIDVWKIAGQHIEEQVVSEYIEDMITHLSLDNKTDIKNKHVTCAVAGFYRSGRRLGNVIDFGDNLWRSLEKGQITKERYDRRLNEFNEEIIHCADMNVRMAGRIFDGLVTELKSEDQLKDTIHRYRNLILTSELNEATALRYKTLINHCKDYRVKLGLKATISQSIITKLQAAFKSAGGLHYRSPSEDT
jgi:hypothetical protein